MPFNSTTPVLSEDLIHHIQNNIITWYQANHRQLPWRETKDPYRIWVSEIMLQQTQVDTVIAYYNRFIETLPTVYDLANVDDEILMKLWEGLGYYRRVRNLKKAAGMVIEQFNGKIPQSKKAILSLSGIGPYTAGAILSIAYNLPEPAIDGNVIRVYARLFKIEDEVNQTFVQKYIAAIGTALVAEKDPSSYNQGLMELGALICTPANPNCGHCPVAHICEAKMAGIQSELPRKKTKKKASEHRYDLCLIEKEGYLLVVKRGLQGVLEGQWSLPQIERQRSQQALCDWIKEHFNLDVKPISSFENTTHVFSHRKWMMRYKRFKVTAGFVKTHQEYRWIPLDDLNQVAFPTAYLKILKKTYSIE